MNPTQKGLVNKPFSHLSPSRRLKTRPYWNRNPHNPLLYVKEPLSLYVPRQEPFRPLLHKNGWPKLLRSLLLRNKLPRTPKKQYGKLLNSNPTLLRRPLKPLNLAWLYLGSNGGKSLLRPWLRGPPAGTKRNEKPYDWPCDPKLKTKTLYNWRLFPK